MSRPAVSVCVIAMNEEDRIAACLRSADFADEWIVVDSHSTDRTREIAAEYGARVVERDWPGHVEQKSFALSLARNDWVLCLDADERVSPELRESMLVALDSESVAHGFEMNRRSWYLGRWIYHGGWYPDRKLRLFRRSRGRWGGTNPHDRVEIEGRVERLRGDLLHYSYRNLSDHLRTIDSFTTIAARERHRLGRRSHLSAVILRPAWKFLKMYLVQRGFLDGRAGFFAALTGAYYVFLKYAKQWELERSERQQ